MRGIHCKHYRYPMNDGEKCAAGVEIRATFKSPWPCYSSNLPPASAPCALFCAFTPEEPAAREVETGAAIARMLAANKAVGEYEEQHGVSNVVRTITCPNCHVENGLKFASDRHHRYAQCLTPKCVQFRGSFGR